MFKENFTRRHIGPDPSELNIMLKKIGVKSIEELLEQTIPDKIRIKGDLKIPDGISEMEFLKEIWMFLRVRKKLWLAPIITVMLILGG